MHVSYPDSNEAAMHRPLILVAYALAAPFSMAQSQTDPAQSAFTPPPAPSPAEGTLFWYPERVPIGNGRTLLDAERGIMFVPTKRSDPASRVTGVEVYRFRAADTVDPNTPPVFLLNGGPGWPGLGGSLENEGFYERAIKPFHDVADLVIVGQRGIGSSKPNTICAPGGRASANCRDYWETANLDLQGFTVIEAAADVRDIAEALGYDQIQLSGGSFGSHWSMAVLRFHPEIVARAVLHGMEGPDHTYDMPSWVLNSITRMAEEAANDPELAPLVPEGGLVNAFVSVIDRLDGDPARITVENPHSGEEQPFTFTAPMVRGLAYGYSSRISSRRGMPSWPADILYLYYGDYQTAAQRILAARGSGGGRPNYRTASYFMLDCGSGITPDRLEALNADTAAAIVGALGFYYQANCPSWDSDLGDGFRQNFDTDVPTVIVHGNWDVNTPYENALELVPHFTQSMFVTVNGGSHGALREALDANAAFREALMSFMRTGDMSGLPDRVDLPPVHWEIPTIHRD